MRSFVAVWRTCAKALAIVSNPGDKGKLNLVLAIAKYVRSATATFKEFILSLNFV